MLYPFIFAIIIIILMTIFILTLRIKTKIECIKKRDSSDIEVLFTLFSGVLKRKYVIPIPDFLEIFEKVYNKYTRSGAQKKVFKNTNRLMTFINIYIVDLRKYFLGKNVPQVKLNIKILYGTDNAFWTGVIGGAIFGIAGALDSLVSNRFKIIEKNISIQSDFSKNILEIEALCILSLRFAHAMRIGMIYLYELITKISKNRVRRWFKWQNIQ